MSETITIERTTDRAFINSVFRNPAIYPHLIDDSCPQDPMLVPELDSVPGFFLRVLKGGVPVGAFWLRWCGEEVECHTAMLPECRGRDALAAARAGTQWVFDHTVARAITSYAWSDSPAVAWFCRAAGMKLTETKPWHATRNGHSVDIAYYRINREDVWQQSQQL